MERWREECSSRSPRRRRPQQDPLGAPASRQVAFKSAACCVLGQSCCCTTRSPASLAAAPSSPRNNGSLAVARELISGDKLKYPAVRKGRASRSRPARYKSRKQAKAEETPLTIPLQRAAAPALPASTSSKTRPARFRDARMHPATTWAAGRGRGYKRYYLVERVKPGHEFSPASCEFHRLTPIGAKRPLGAAGSFRRNRRDVVSHRSAHRLSHDHAPAPVSNMRYPARGERRGGAVKPSGCPRLRGMPAFRACNKRTGGLLSKLSVADNAQLTHEKKGECRLRIYEPDG